MTASLVFGAVVDYAQFGTLSGLELSPSTALTNLFTKWPRELWIPKKGVSGEPFAGSTLVSSTIKEDLGQLRSIGSVFLGNLNSTRAAKCRVRMSAAAISARERLAPDSTVSSADYTNDHTFIDDDPEAPDGSFMETEVDTAAVAIFTMDDPADQVLFGDIQVIRALVQAPPEGPSTVRVEIDEGASVLATPISDVVVPAGQKIMLHGLWDAVVLGSDGSAVRLLVTITGGQVTDGDTQLHALDWFALTEDNQAGYEGRFREIVPAGMPGATLGDAALANTTLMKNFHEPVNLAEAVGGSLPIVYAPVSVRFIEIELFDPLNPGSGAPFGFNSAGRLMAGEAVYFGDGDSGPERGWSPGIDPPEPDNATRTIDIPLALLSNASSTELLAYALGQSRDRQVVVHVRPSLADDQKTSHHLPFLAQPTGAVNLSELLVRSESVFSGSLSMREFWGTARE